MWSHEANCEKNTRLRSIFLKDFQVKKPGVRFFGKFQFVKSKEDFNFLLVLFVSPDGGWLLPRINFQQIWQVYTSLMSLFPAYPDIRINGPIEPIWKLVPTRLRNEKERIFQLHFLLWNSSTKRLRLARSMAQGHKELLFFLGGGGNILFSRQLGKWKVGRWDESIVQTKLLMAQKSGDHHLGCI